MSQSTLLELGRQLQASGGVLDPPRQILARDALSLRYNLSTAPTGRLTKAVTAVAEALTPGPTMVTALTETVEKARIRTPGRAL